MNDRSLIRMLVNIIAACLAVVLGVVLSGYIFTILSIVFWLVLVFGCLWWYRMVTDDS